MVVATVTTATLAGLTTANTGKKLHFLYFILPLLLTLGIFTTFSFVQYIIFLYAKSSFTFNHKNSILHFVSRQTNNK
jgi:hypothetical protein